MEFEKVFKPQDSSFKCHKRDEYKFDFLWHYHPEYELTLITSGSGKRYVGDNISEYKKGDLVLLGSNLPHSWKSAPFDPGKPARNKAVVIQFPRNFLGNDFYDRPELSEIHQLLEQSCWGIKFTFDKPDDLHRRIEKVSKLSGFKRLLKFLEILDFLSKCPDKQALSTTFLSRPHNPDEQKRIEKIFNYIHLNYTSDISLTRIASTVHMSPSNFSQYFRKISGRSFISYLNDLKISKACEFLSNSDRPITSICFDSGFRNLSNFNRQFLKRKQISPTQYRKEYFGTS